MKSHLLHKYPIRQFNANLVPKRPAEVTGKKLSSIAKLFIGGTSAIALSFRYNRFAVSCTSNRLAGYHTNVAKNDTVTFDWRKFWHYLKPYLLKFIGAIAVIS